MPVHHYGPLPDGITHALFDADDTLYPSSCGFQSVHIRKLIQDLFWQKYREREGQGASREASNKLSFWYYHNHRSAYVGMVREFGMSMEEIVDHVYHSGRLDYTVLDPCEQTRAGLEVIRYGHKLRLAILSNGTDVHVHQVLSAMGLTGLFGVVHGFNHNGYKPKPELSTIKNTLWDMNTRAENTIFIEDSLDNLRAARGLGMGYNVYIGEEHPTPPENEDNTFDLWAKTLPEALSAINDMLSRKKKAA